MTTIETILAHLGSGRVTRREALAALARLVTLENVGEVMTALPQDVAADLELWAGTVPARGGVVIGANLSSDEAQRLGESLHVASKAVRIWAAAQGRHAIGEDGLDGRSIRPAEKGS